MLYFKLEQVDQKDFVVQRHYNFAEPDLYLLYFGSECHISNYFLSL